MINTRETVVSCIRFVWFSIHFLRFYMHFVYFVAKKDFTDRFSHVNKKAIFSIKVL